MSGGVGVAQFRKCQCGGLLNDGWDACKFCGTTAEELAEAEAGALSDGEGRDGDSKSSESWSLPILPLAVVVLVVGVIGYFVVDSSTGRDGTSRSDDAQRAAVTVEFEAWCAGDRSIGISDAPPYDHEQTDRAVFVAPPSSTTPVSVDDTGEYASVIVCQDMVGAPVDGGPCEGQGSRKVASFTLVAYAARNGQRLGEMDAGPDLSCPAAAESGTDEAPTALPAPDPSVTVQFAAMFAGQP